MQSCDAYLDCVTGHRIVMRYRPVPPRVGGADRTGLGGGALLRGGPPKPHILTGKVALMVTDGSWLVGLGFRTPCGRLVRHFYVVDGAADAEHARKAALERADQPRERAARADLRLEDGCVEIRRVLARSCGVPGGLACPMYMHRSPP